MGFPLEVEHCLNEHPAVLEVAVILIEVNGLRHVLASPYDRRFRNR